MDINCRIYTGKELIAIPQETYTPLIEDLLYENDYIMVVAEPKMGKTIFTQQLACNLSSGTPFLGMFSIPCPVKVWYFATEGKDNDLRDRFIRIGQFTSMIPENITLFCSPLMKFNTVLGRRFVDTLLQQYKDELPKVIIIDALYMAILGSLVKDDVVGGFHTAIREFAEKCGAAVILVHHMTKPVKDKEGRLSDRFESDAYGSVFIMGAVDHCIWLDRCNKINKQSLRLNRILRCESQRSGTIIDNVRLELVEPSPLGFRVIDIHREEQNRIVAYLLEKKRCDVEEIAIHIDMSLRTVRTILKKMSNQLEEEREGTKIFYKLRRYRG